MIVGVDIDNVGGGKLDMYSLPLPMVAPQVSPLTMWKHC